MVNHFILSHGLTHLIAQSFIGKPNLLSNHKSILTRVKGFVHQLRQMAVGNESLEPSTYSLVSDIMEILGNIMKSTRYDHAYSFSFLLTDSRIVVIVIKVVSSKIWTIITSF